MRFKATVSPLEEACTPSPHYIFAEQNNHSEKEGGLIGKHEREREKEERDYG